MAQQRQMAALKKLKIFCDTIYARVAELVLGSTPAGTPGWSMAPHVTGVRASWQPAHEPPWRSLLIGGKEGSPTYWPVIGAEHGQRSDFSHSSLASICCAPSIAKTFWISLGFDASTIPAP
jgi:hypothetical protein